MRRAVACFAKTFFSLHGAKEKMHHCTLITRHLSCIQIGSEPPDGLRSLNRNSFIELSEVNVMDKR